MYQLEVSDTQLKVIKTALEEYFRVRMGQYWDFADDLAMQRYNYMESGTINHEVFDDYIILRDVILDKLQKLDSSMFHLSNKYPQSTETMRIAQDMWGVIKHQLWEDFCTDKTQYCVDAYPPLQMSAEPLPKIQRKEEKEC